MAIRRPSHLILRIGVLIALMILTSWSAAAIWIDGPESRVLAGKLAGASSSWSPCLLQRCSAPCGGPPSRSLFRSRSCSGWWLTLAASGDRDWQTDVAALPTATVDGSSLTVRNVRNFDYRSTTDFTERWETRTFDLDALLGVDIFIAFWGPTLYGHTITSWEFGDGNHLTVSIETRKEEGEEYSAVRGFFRQFELYYVVVDERDLIALRTNHRGEKVELYRMIASREGARALLDDYVREMNALAEKPRWYNALTHNCTTTIWHHARAVGSDFPTDWRLLANGYLIDLAYERGLVNTDIGLEELKRRSDITERARTADIREGFSETIREELPARFRKGTPDATAIE